VTFKTIGFGVIR